MTISEITQAGADKSLLGTPSRETRAIEHQAFQVENK
jgi:hypothetical protein